MSACAFTENRTRHHGEPATVPAATAGAGFERLFRSAVPSEDEPRTAAELAGHAAKAGRQARRLPSISAIRTAYEHNHEPSEPLPRLPPERIQLALDLEETSEQGWGPARSSAAYSDRPEGQPDRPGGLAIPSLPEPRGPNRAFHATPAEVSRARSHEPSGLAGGLASPPYAPEGATRAVLAYARTRKLFPGSIRSSTSCHRVAPTSGGWPDTVRSQRRPKPARHPSDPAAQTSYPRIANETRTSICGPPYDQLALGARGVLARCSRRARELPGFTGSAGEPSDSDTSSFSRCPKSARPARPEGRAARAAALPGPRARVPRRSAKSGRDRRYPRCFPSIDHQRPRQWAYARSASRRGHKGPMPPDQQAGPVAWQGAFHSLSPACGEHTAPFSTPARSGSLDGPPVSESAVSAASCRAEAQPDARRWLPIRLQPTTFP
jgi:hypothetical protein